jgi:hypothetical protein
LAAEQLVTDVHDIGLRPSPGATRLEFAADLHVPSASDIFAQDPAIKIFGAFQKLASRPRLGSRSCASVDPFAASKFLTKRSPPVDSGGFQ